MLHPPVAGLLVVDLQPAYAQAIGNTLVSQVARRLAELPEDVPVCALYVNEELSGDTREDVLEFWLQHDVPTPLLDRIRWIEKPYAFLRGWMDNGVPEGEIVTALAAMRSLECWDSRNLPLDVLQSLSPSGAQLYDPLLRAEELEDLAAILRMREGCWLTAGGGRDECLAEVELVLRSHDIAFLREDTLTY